MDNYLSHEGRSKKDGAPVGSGRYPLGSGENPNQHSATMYDRIRALENDGISDKEIAKALGFVNPRTGEPSTKELRIQKQIARNDAYKARVANVKKLKEHGYANTTIAEKLGVTEGTVRQDLKAIESGKYKQTKIDALAETLRCEVKKRTYLDIGDGVETELGTSKESLRTAVGILEKEGYQQHKFKVNQPTNPKQQTTMLVLTDSTKTWSDARNNRDKIQSPSAKEIRDDISDLKMKPPVSIDPKRVMIRYAEDDGIKKDGVIEIRQGVDDLILPNNRIYAQTRIAVGGTHYLKGMAVYSDNMPDGVDIIFNTNKDKSVPMMGSDKNNTVLKPMKNDVDNPFGATVRQYGRDETGDWKLLNGAEKVEGKTSQSPINIVNEDPDWDKWSKNLSSQFLSKQYPAVAKEQLKIAYEKRKNEFNEICDLTNPTVKKKLLADFADQCDSDAVNLKAAQFPRQATHVILPLTNIKDNEIYAPNYKQGEPLMLVRYPHEGPFQSPVLINNLNNKEGKKIMGQAQHAVGINANAAEMLSGADFDGDTVVVIPITGQHLKTPGPLKGLQGYDPKVEYKKMPGDPVTAVDDRFNTQQEMGKISNLITDMHIKGASTDEFVRAVRHSMCVIDAEKHNLDWKRSEDENKIKELKEIYQGGANRGASTLISKASAEERLPYVRKDGVTVVNPETGKKSRMYIDPDTGEKLYTKEERSYVDKKTGETKWETTPSTKMYEAKDAYELMSPDRTRIEVVYADHANRLKAMGNQARLELLKTGDIAYNREAAKKYEKEVASLNYQLDQAKLRRPQERRAVAIADVIIKGKIDADPSLKDKENKDKLKKIRAQAIGSTRARLGLTRYDIRPTDKEWEAIQSGAISKTKLEQILLRSDTKRIRELATPKQKRKLAASTVALIKKMAANPDLTQSEIAATLGLSVDTVKEYM